MNDIAILVPSLGRPQNAVRLIDAWQATSEGRSDLWFLLDSDDSTRYDYVDACKGTGANVEIGPPARLVAWTNRVAVGLPPSYRVFGSIGDDHRFESAGWESAILDAVDQLGGTAIVGTNDLVHGEAIPTACFVTSNIVQALGWMALPTLEHLFCDNAWKSLAVAAGVWRYLPDVKIAHHHPLVGKAPHDATYEIGNAPEVWARDHAAYEAWLADGLEADAAKVRALKRR